MSTRAREGDFNTMGKNTANKQKKELNKSEPEGQAVPGERYCYSKAKQKTPDKELLSGEDWER